MMQKGMIFFKKNEENTCHTSKCKKKMKKVEKAKIWHMTRFT